MIVALFISILRIIINGPLASKLISIDEVSIIDTGIGSSDNDKIGMAN